MEKMDNLAQVVTTLLAPRHLVCVEVAMCVAAECAPLNCLVVAWTQRSAWRQFRVTATKKNDFAFGV